MKEAQVILNRLLDKFENSKHLSEPNTSRRRVMLRIDKRELPEYQYEDAVVRDAYNIAARELEQQALVRLEWARKQSVLSCIVLDLERVAQCYECADRVHPRKTCVSCPRCPSQRSSACAPSLRQGSAVFALCP